MAFEMGLYSGVSAGAAKICFPSLFKCQFYCFFVHRAEHRNGLG